MEAGPSDEFSNGNGSLMRILPLVFYVDGMDRDKQFEITHQVSRITHGHIRSQMACGIYVQSGINLLNGYSPKVAYERTKEIVLEYYSRPPYAQELSRFSRILKEDISELPEDSIESDGYAVHTLEAALWCFLNGSSYEDTALTAVNLGRDADTTGAVVGGLAGIYYGCEGIPQRWIKALARADDIIQLGKRLYESIAVDNRE